MRKLRIYFGRRIEGMRDTRFQESDSTTAVCGCRVWNRIGDKTSCEVEDGSHVEDGWGCMLKAKEGGPPLTKCVYGTTGGINVRYRWPFDNFGIFYQSNYEPLGCLREQF